MALWEYQPNDIDGSTVDYVVIGGGPAGIASAMYLAKSEGTNANTSVLALTSGREFGGMADRSAEQVRLLQASRSLAFMAALTMEACFDIEMETGCPILDQIPYAFLVGQESPDKPDRRTVDDYFQMYKNSIDEWGYDPDMEFFEEEEIGNLQNDYPFLDGSDITGAALVHNAGKIRFDNLRNELIRSSLGNARYAAGVTAGRIVLGKGNKVIGVETDRGLVQTEQVVLAPGANIVQTSRLFAGSSACEAIEEFESRFTVTQRELFTAPLPCLRTNTDYGKVFVISPDGAWVRINRDKVTGDVDGTFGYAGPNDITVSEPLENPRPLSDTRRSVPFVAEVYDLLSGSISLLDSEHLPRPNGTSAGYYAAYTDHQPTIGALPGEVSGVTLAAGGEGEGVMTMMGVGHIVRESIRKEGRIREDVMREVNPGRHLSDNNQAPLRI